MTMFGSDKKETYNSKLIIELLQISEPATLELRRRV